MKRDVSRFGLGVAVLCFVCFVCVLVGAAAGQELMNTVLGPLPLGVWLLLMIHVLPVVFGIVHMNRAER